MKRVEATGREQGRLQELATSATVEVPARFVEVCVGRGRVDDGLVRCRAGGVRVSGESIAEAFARLAVELHDVDGLEETVEAVVEFACQAVECDAAAAALIGADGDAEVLAMTDPKLSDLFRLQLESGEGPVLTAVRTGAVVSIPQVEAETRWSPVWRKQIAALGIQSALHLPLLVSGRHGAVLSLYREEPGGFDEADVAVAHILARHATVAIGTALRDENLSRAVDARKLVGQAMGILMERYGLDGDRAFEVLKRYSQNNNRKLRDVAQELIDTRRLPGSRGLDN
ncbi:GAF and ANTAR domain-containing protein [Kribbella hippodromi]|uniref:GAF and ANTAR domain-containing protein n=1 Tax=Kribbella hippodromi TaxID=434347 RepID=UPI0031D132F5